MLNIPDLYTQLTHDYQYNNQPTQSIHKPQIHTEKTDDLREILNILYNIPERNIDTYTLAAYAGYLHEYAFPEEELYLSKELPPQTQWLMLRRIIASILDQQENINTTSVSHEINSDISKILSHKLKEDQNIKFATTESIESVQKLRDYLVENYSSEAEIRKLTAEELENIINPDFNFIYLLVQIEILPVNYPRKIIKNSQNYFIVIEFLANLYIGEWISRKNAIQIIQDRSIKESYGEFNSNNKPYPHEDSWFKIFPKDHFNHITNIQQGAKNLKELFDQNGLEIHNFDDHKFPELLTQIVPNTKITLRRFLTEYYSTKQPSEKSDLSNIETSIEKLEDIFHDFLDLAQN